MRRWSLSDLALSRPVTVGMALIAVVLLGAISLTRLPLAFLPTEDSPRLYVRVHVTRTSPQILEREVIRPIEGQIAGLRDLRRLQVGSGSWGVRMNLEFDPGTDADARKLELRDRLERVRPELPDLVQRWEIGSYTMNDDPVMELQVSSDVDLSDNYYLIEQRVVRPIERIKGVSRVELSGVAPHEMEIAVDLEGVSRSGVDLADVGTVVRDARRGRSMGLVRGSDADTGVRSPAQEADVREFAALPLRRGRGRGTQPAATATTSAEAQQDPGEHSSARLDEVADISVHPEERREGQRLNGRPAINLEVFAAAGTSTVEITEEITQVIGDLDDDPALRGIDVQVFHDQGEVILETLGDLRNTGLWGGTLGILVLFAFLHRWRTTLAAAISIPLSVLAACAVLFLRGDELNCIVLLGLVLGVGMLIDNAVVIVESIALQSQRGRDPMTAARFGAREVGIATMASTLSSVIVFLALIVGDEGDRMTTMLRPLGLTFSIALVSSLLVSQMAVPLLMGRILQPKAKPVHHPVLDRVSRAYAWLVQRTLRFPRLMGLLGLLLAASSAIPLQDLNIDLRDMQNKGDHLPIRVQIAGSRGYELVGERVAEMESALLERREALGIESIACSYRDWGGRCRVYPSEPAESEADMEQFEAGIAAVLPEQAGVTYRLGEREFHWSENRDRRVVDFALKGEDMAVLMELAADVADHLEAELEKGDPANPEAGGYDVITTPFTEGSKELEVVPDVDKLRRLGLSVDDVAQRVSLAFQGLPMGQVRGEHGEIGLRLSVEGMGEDAEDESRSEPDLQDLRDLRLVTPEGREVPLGTLAEFRITAAPHWTQRIDRQTEVRLQVRFFRNDPAANQQSIERVMGSFDFPRGYDWGQSTPWRQRKKSQNVLINLGLSLILVYAVMASLFESFLQPLAILVTCVLGGFGAPWALWMTETTLDMTTVIGFFILIGIVVNNGIMLIDKVTQLRAAGMEREEALRIAGRDRLRPILMTATTTMLGLVPMLIHHPTLAGVYYHSIAIVITGGLATSTFITLVFLPAGYALLEDISLAARAWWNRVAG